MTQLMPDQTREILADPAYDHQEHADGDPVRAAREATLERSNIYQRQMVVSGDVSVCNLVERITDSACQNDRQSGCDYRKDDQSGGDADDLLPD